MKILTKKATKLKVFVAKRVQKLLYLQQDVAIFFKKCQEVEW